MWNDDLDVSSPRLALLATNILLLLILTNSLSSLHKSLGIATVALASVPPAQATIQSPISNPHAATPRRRADATPRKPAPTADSLQPDLVKKGWASTADWAPLGDDELRVVDSIRGWLGAERFGEVPHDILVAFIRGYAYRADWAETTYVYLASALSWRREADADTLALSAPKRCELFDELCPGGPIGFDGEGHPILLERPGAIPPARLLELFSEEDFIRHQCYRREVFRLYSVANSAQRGKRLYKATVIVDLRGFGTAHMSRKLIAYLKALNAVFDANYPESINKLYIINTPWAFRSLWGLIKPWLNPITVSKFTIVGFNWRTTLAEAGISLTSGDVPECPPRWCDEMAALVREHDVRSLRRGYLPEKDRLRLA